MFRLEVRRIRLLPARRRSRVLPLIWPAYRIQGEQGWGILTKGSWRIGPGPAGNLGRTDEPLGRGEGIPGIRHTRL